MIRVSTLLAAWGSILVAGCATSTDPAPSADPAPGAEPAGDPSAPDQAGPPPTTNGWTSTPVPFVAYFNDVTISYTLEQPTAVDATIGAANGRVDALDDLGPIVRLDPQGVLQVADGGSFRADAAVDYTTGPVAIVMHVDLETHRYSVQANGVRLATDYAFHAGQAALSRIDTIGTAGGAAGSTVQLRDLAVGPPFCSTAGQAWVDLAHPDQRGAYHVRFDARVPAGAGEGVIGLASHDVASAGDLVASVRFSAAGTLDARDGGAYRADHAIGYTPDTTYQFTLDVDPAAGRYSVAVRPQGAASTTQPLALGYAFAPAQGTPAPLTEVGLFSQAGYVRLCNLTVWNY